MKRVVFVCAGNICRSPMAEALFRAYISSRPALSSLEVASAGIWASGESRASSGAASALREQFQLDLSDHRSTRLTEEENGDLILTMDDVTTQAARELGLKGRVALIGDYAGCAGECVEDPMFSESAEKYRRCAQQLDRLIRAVVDRIERELKEKKPAGRGDRRA